MRQGWNFWWFCQFICFASACLLFSVFLNPFSQPRQLQSLFQEWCSLGAVVRSRIANAFVLVDSGHLLIHMGERTGYTRGSGCLIGVSDTRDCRLRGIDPVDPDLWCLTLQTHPHSARSSHPFRKNSIHLVSQLPFLQTTSTRRWVRCHGHPWPRPKRLGSNESHGQPVILGHTPLSSSPVTGQ